MSEVFREEVFKRLGMKKGNIQVAIEEAIDYGLKRTSRKCA